MPHIKKNPMVGLELFIPPWSADNSENNEV